MNELDNYAPTTPVAIELDGFSDYIRTEVVDAVGDHVLMYGDDLQLAADAAGRAVVGQPGQSTDYQTEKLGRWLSLGCQRIRWADEPPGNSAWCCLEIGEWPWAAYPHTIERLFTDCDGMGTIGPEALTGEILVRPACRSFCPPALACVVAGQLVRVTQLLRTLVVLLGPARDLWGGGHASGLAEAVWNDIALPDLHWSVLRLLDAIRDYWPAKAYEWRQALAHCDAYAAGLMMNPDSAVAALRLDRYLRLYASRRKPA